MTKNAQIDGTDPVRETGAVRETGPVRQTDPVLGDNFEIVHGFFGRAGGVSPAPYDSLNASISTGDSAENVQQNRENIALHLRLAPQKLAGLSQIHSNKVVTLDLHTDLSARPKADGLVTKLPGIGLGILTADCTPVLFADGYNRVIGACHAGWRGAVDGVVGATISTMIEQGAELTQIHAVIGPTIWQENYEVGDTFKSELLVLHPGAEAHFSPLGANASQHFDLPGFVRAQIRSAGVVDVGQVGGCTYASPDRYYSHRFATHNKATTGRQLSVIALKN